MWWTLLSLPPPNPQPPPTPPPPPQPPPPQPQQPSSPPPMWLWLCWWRWWWLWFSGSVGASDGVGSWLAAVGGGGRSFPFGIYIKILPVLLLIGLIFSCSCSQLWLPASAPCSGYLLSPLVHASLIRLLFPAPASCSDFVILLKDLTFEILWTTLKISISTCSTNYKLILKKFCYMTGWRL